MSSARIVGVIAAGILLAALEATTAVAQPVDENLDHAARLTFQAGSEAFSAGDYATALDRFQQAYDLSHRPVLLYNIATCLDRLRRDEDAVAQFNAYIEALPDAHDRAEVEARVAVLQAAIDERNAEQAERERIAAEAEAERERLRLEAERQAQNPEEDDGGGLHAGVALGLAGATLVVGGLIVWSGLNAVSRNDDFEAEVLFDDVVGAEIRTNALIGVAAALGAATVVIAIFTDWSFGGDSDDDEGDVQATPTASFSRDGGMVGLAGSF
jgi:tetratricopeptide (TPR) repeat protein